MNTAAMLTAALLLDAWLGEPRWLWSRLSHPVVLMGRLISWLELRLNRGDGRRARGILGLVLLLLVVVPLSVVVRWLPYGWVLEIVVGAILLAQRSLIEHVNDVADGLTQSLTKGRSAVSLIVGRDPEQLDEAGVARAAIESAAENFSDGLAAPAFWFLLAGLPGIVLYKAVNTADSMIGHRTERYLAYGWATARLDDVLNWMPARLTGALFCLVGGGIRAVRVMFRDAGQHRSPNAGWPEAAMAASLDVALAGPRDYGTYRVDDPFMNAAGRTDLTVEDIRRSTRLLWRAWAVILALSTTGLLLFL